MPVLDEDLQRLSDLVTASRILVNEGALDSFGHISVRSTKNTDHFFMPRAMPPALVTSSDIIELDLQGNLIDPNSGKPNGERFIHSEIYKVRSDVQAVAHGHSEPMLPFTVTPKRPLRPLVNTAGFLPERVSLFDIEMAAKEDPGVRGKLLINTAALGAALAQELRADAACLLRGHGYVVVGSSLQELVMRTVYTQQNAKVQYAAETLDAHVIYLTEEERKTFAKEIFPDRPWANFKARLRATVEA